MDAATPVRLFPGAPTISPLPPPPAFAPTLPPVFAPAPAPAPAQAPSVRVQNVAPNTGLMARFAHTTQRLKDLTPRGMVKPHGDNGTDVLCLSYSLRGECHSNCTHNPAHRELTPTEVSRVNAFLTQSGVE
jgi:hypothetical protein